MRKWAEEVNKYTPQDVIKMIVANKTDLQRVVTTDEGTKLAEDLGTLYIETSVKDKVNVDETFANLTREILKSNSGKPRQEQGVSNAQLNESARPSSNGSSNQTKKRRCMI